jgi:hypothetical protein
MLDLLFERNPKGGRPMKPGQLVYDSTAVSVDRVVEETCIRYHVGYCPCGRRTVIGPEQASILIRTLERNGMRAKESVPIRKRLAKLIYNESEYLSTPR